MQKSPCGPTAPPDSSLLPAVASVSFLHTVTQVCSQFELVCQPVGTLPVTNTAVPLDRL